MISRLTSIALVSVAALSGCAANPPKELVDARDAYERAKTSQAASVTPADVASARDALLRAEASFDDDGDNLRTRSYAYVAERMSERAIVRAGTLVAERDRANAEKQLIDTATSTAEGLSKEVSEKDRQLATTGEKLRDERSARIAAEKKAQDALNRLVAFATVKEEARGLVITLPGGVLFETNKATLLGTAEERLNQVADALLSDRDATIVIEGHTDSQGNDAINDKLSKDRADSVREYLLKRGVAPDRLTAVGKGSKQPIADNKSPEGRANNRRVEIIVSGRAANAAKIAPPANTKTEVR